MDFVSGNGHLVENDEERVVKFITIMAEAFCETHEEDKHDSDDCIAVRISLAAYIAHHIGVRLPEHIERMLDLMAEYEERAPR